MFQLEPNSPPSTLTIGPSSAPKNPPLCTIRFFSVSGVFFNTNFRNERLWRLSRLLCSEERLTFPTSTFLTHSQIHLMNYGLQCCFVKALRALGDDLCNSRR